MERFSRSLAHHLICEFKRETVMTILEIVLLIIGLGLIIGSFFVSERLSSKDKENLQKLTRDQIESIIKDNRLNLISC